MSQTLVCENCGTAFERTGTRGRIPRFCSPECRSKPVKSVEQNPALSYGRSDRVEYMVEVFQLALSRHDLGTVPRSILGPLAEAAVDAQDLMLYDVMPNQTVEFKRGGGNFQTGRVRRVQSDGSMLIYDSKGASRSILPKHVYVRRLGPRGGKGERQPVGERMHNVIFGQINEMDAKLKSAKSARLADLDNP